jgi:hypothetical protein
MQRRHWVVVVVVLLVGVAAALLVTAVLRVRAVAARVSCAGHFSMLAVTLHGYAHSHDDAFPAGTVPHAELPPEERLSWWVAVLPYASRDEVYKQFDLTRGPGDPANRAATQNRWRHIVCPASGEWTSAAREDRWKSPTPLTHYVGVAGVGVDAATLPLGHPRAGAFGHDRRTPLKDGFPDGTSGTLLVIETGKDPGHWAYGGYATVRTFEPGTSPSIGEGRPFGGFHNGPVSLVRPRDRICVAGLADGSYRYFTDKTDPAVLEALATVGGKEALPENW